MNRRTQNKKIEVENLIDQAFSQPKNKGIRPTSVQSLGCPKTVTKSPYFSSGKDTPVTAIPSQIPSPSNNDFIKPKTQLEIQVQNFKFEYPGTILAVQVGYMYHFFGEDAKLASELLGIDFYQQKHKTLPLASVPEQRIGYHCWKLAQVGHKIGIIRQGGPESEAASTSTGLVREIDWFLTKGTFLNRFQEAAVDEMVQHTPPRLVFLLELSKPDHDRCPSNAGITSQGCTFGLVFIQINSGIVLCQQIEEENSLRHELFSQLQELNPNELIGINITPATRKIIDTLFDSNTLRLELKERNEMAHANNHLLEFYGSEKYAELALASFSNSLVFCVSAAIEHLSEMRLEQIMRELKPTRPNKCMKLNESHLIRLEEVVKALDFTRTPTGSKILRDWFENPLALPEDILERRQAVEELANKLISGQLQFMLRLDDLLNMHMPDLYSWTLGVCRHNTQPKFGFKALQRLLPIMKLAEYPLPQFTNRILASLILKLSGLKNGLEALKDTICLSKLQFTLNLEDLLIADSESKILSQHIKLVEKNLSEYLETIPFKARYTQVGVLEYLLEVSTQHQDLVPSDWVIVSKTKAAIRYRSTESLRLLSDLEVAREQLNLYNHRKFKTIWKMVPFSALLEGCQALGTLDALLSLSKQRFIPGYSCPDILHDETAGLEIIDGIHPLAEKWLGDQSNYIPNSTQFNGNVIMLTGPNMGGKSMYLHQVGLLVIIAQVGAYVPCQYMKIYPRDSIYLRINNLSHQHHSNSSSLYHELSQTSKILNKATSRSLVLVDELLSTDLTYVGRAILESFMVAIVDGIQCPMIFITHHHYMFTKHMASINNVCSIISMYMDYILPEDSHNVVFLYKLRPGIAPSSYGINVARAAGLPTSVINRARQVINERAFQT